MNNPDISDMNAALPAVLALDMTKQRMLAAIDTFEAAKSSREIMLEVDAAAVIAPLALIGRSIRVYWPDDDAWYLGVATKYDPATGKHAVDYVDGTKEQITMALDRIRLFVTVGAELPVASHSDIAAYCAVLESRANRTDANDPEEAQKLRAKITELMKLLNPPPPVVPRSSSEKENAAAAGVPSQIELVEQFRVGDLVWAQVKGFPPWPAMIVTPQHGYNGKSPKSEKVKQTRKSMVPVVYFGTFERSWQKPATLTPMRDGIERNFHIGKTTKRRQFAAAICEVCDFMTNGELPEGLFPCNDEPDSDEEDEGEEETGRKGNGERPGKRAKKSKGDFDRKSFTWGALSKEAGMPLQVGKSLKVLSLGKIEWLHPAFHDEKSIWPVGYKAERVAKTPAGGDNPIRHLCEVLEAPDGSGPIFRQVLMY